MTKPHQAILAIILIIILQLTSLTAIEIKFPRPMLHKMRQTLSTDSLTIQTINLLMDYKKIPNSNQYQNCFTS